MAEQSPATSTAEPLDAHVAVLGAGIMGRGIAQVFAAAGAPTRLYEPQAETREAALGEIDATMRRAVARGRLDDSAREATLERITVVGDVPGAVADARLVIEAAPEDLELKQRLFADVVEAAPPGAILASNTSALSISAIGSRTDRPERILGLHFFNPVPRLPLVEVVRGMQTRDEVISEAVELCRAAGKEPVVVDESPGFATSRMNAMIGNEAFYMLMEGVASAEDIDRAMKLGLNHPMGPLELGDLVGLDTRLSVLRHLHATLGEKFRPCPLLVRYVEAGRLGRKTGAGVYDYDEDGTRISPER